MQFLHILDRILETQLFVVAGTPVNVATLLMFVVIIILSFVVSAGTQRAVRRAFKRRGVDCIVAQGYDGGGHTGRVGTMTIGKQ